MTSFDEFAPESLVRAAFCSEANFSSWADPRGVELEISRIMYPSPRTEADERVGGIFHYGNRYFLQCLEGPRQAVEQLYERNRADDRHKNQEVRVVEPISERLFPENSMSYVSMRGDLIELLQQHGVDEFNPYRLDATVLSKFLERWREKHQQRRSTSTA